MTRRTNASRLLGVARTIGALLAGVLVAVASGCGASGRHAADSRDDVRDIEGRAVVLSGGGAPAASVLIFVRSDCPISNRFAPEINRLHAEFGPRGADFLLVYVDPDETEGTIRGHRRDYGYTCRAVPDPRHRLAARCGAAITPEAAVIVPDGEVVYRGRINDLYVDLGRARPAATTRDLADALAATLDHRPVAVARTRAVGCTIADLRR